MPTAPSCTGTWHYARKVSAVSATAMPRPKPPKGFGCLWSGLKTEELEGREWPVFVDLDDVQASITTYFDYYNYERLHSSFGYQVPYRAHQQLT
jgi:transposase InsO family protein